MPVQVSAGKGNPGEVVMVDPLEAKRLATKQMEEIKAREKLGVSQLLLFLVIYTFFVLFSLHICSRCHWIDKGDSLVNCIFWNIKVFVTQ